MAAGAVRRRDPRVLVAVLVATKLADVATTLVGLHAAPNVRETNPVVADAIAAVGAPVALLGLSVAGVAVIVAATEAAVAGLARHPSASRRDLESVRLVGYGLPSVAYALVAAQNAVVVAVAWTALGA